MISYPGEILRRFGRYEAVEDLESTGRVHLWGAWDPFLERFVIIAELDGLGIEEVLSGVQSAGAALERWTNAKLTDSDAVLDFSPGGLRESPFLVVANAAAETIEDVPEQEVPRSEDLHAGPPHSAAPRLRSVPGISEVPATATRWLVLVATAAALLTGALAGYFVRGRADVSPAQPPARPEPLAISTTGDRSVAAGSPTPTITDTPAAAAPSPTVAATLAAPPRAEAPTDFATAVPFPSHTSTDVARARLTATPNRPTSVEAPGSTPTLAREPAGKGRIELDPARSDVAPGDVVRVKARFPGVPDPTRLECTWLVDGAGATHFCEALEYALPKEHAPGQLQVVLTASPPGGETALRGQVRIAVRAAVPSSPAVASATPAPAGSRPVGVGDASVSLGERGARNALEAYRARLEDAQRARYDPSATLVFDGVSLTRVGDTYVATFTQRLESVRPQSSPPKQRTVRIEPRTGTWVVGSN